MANPRSPASPRDVEPLSQELHGKIVRAGYDVAERAHAVRGNRFLVTVDYEMLFVDSMYRELRDVRVPAGLSESNNPQFWEYVHAFGIGARRYVDAQPKRPSIPSRFERLRD